MTARRVLPRGPAGPAALESMRTSMPLDIGSAYLLTAARVGAWIVVSALVFRALGEAAFGMFALGRSTVGLLAYTALGLGPAMMRLLAESRTNEALAPHGLADDLTSPRAVFASGSALALALGAIGTALALLYAHFYGQLHVIPPELVSQTRWLIGLWGIGVVFRVIGDVPGAVLQTHGRIALDNLLQAAAELLWMGAVAATIWQNRGLGTIGLTFLAVSGLLWLARLTIAGVILGLPRITRARRAVVWRLLAFGVMVMFSQSAEFLYAPVDYIIINRLLAPEIVAYYAPALQIDGALLLLVTAVGAVLLPKSALAHTAGDFALVRTYYIRGTLLTTAVLLSAAAVTALLSKWIFLTWLGDEMPVTRAILPAVLLHTTMGGSGAVGRSVLIGMGRVRQYTTAVLIAGVMNMVLALVFVRFFGWGLWGIVLATNIVVFARAAVWQPWYVLRLLKRQL